jgi:hypothetical protein
LDAAVDTNRAQETIRISKFQPQRFYILMTWKSISHGLTKMLRIIR